MMMHERSSYAANSTRAHATKRQPYQLAENLSVDPLAGQCYRNPPAGCRQVAQARGRNGFCSDFGFSGILALDNGA